MNDLKLPMIGIVTVLYHSDDVIPDFLSSIAAQTGNFRLRLYVIDNSPANSGTLLCKTICNRLRISAQFIFNCANLGVAKGNNQGIALALSDLCEYVLLANNDIVFEGSTIQNLLQGAINTKSFAVAPKIMYHGEQDLIWYAGGHINGWTIKSPHYGDKQRDVGQFNKQRYVGYAPTCFLLLHRSVFDVVGTMDEKYFVYSDDTDFIWRMNASGIKILFSPGAVVQHKVSTSTGGSKSAFSVYYTNRNRIFFLRKNVKGFQRAVAFIYVLSTRPHRLFSLPKNTSKRGWQGVIDGFRMPLQ